jgi:hypothetical protein
MENGMMRTVSMAALLAAVAGFGPVALAQHGQAAPKTQERTVQLQGDQSAWINNDYMRGYFALTKETLGPTAASGGAAPLDFDDYREKSYAIFREFGKSMGGDPDMMVDHLKDIPRQMVGIVKDDPKVLDSYDNFVVALMGPQ